MISQTVRLTVRPVLELCTACVTSKVQIELGRCDYMTQLQVAVDACISQSKPWWKNMAVNDRISAATLLLFPHPDWQ